MPDSQNAAKAEASHSTSATEVSTEATRVLTAGARCSLRSTTSGNLASPPRLTSCSTMVFSWYLNGGWLHAPSYWGASFYTGASFAPTRPTPLRAQYHLRRTNHSRQSRITGPKYQSVGELGKTTYGLTRVGVQSLEFDALPSIQSETLRSLSFAASKVA